MITIQNHLGRQALTAAEIAGLLGLSRQTVYRMCREGTFGDPLPGIKRNKLYPYSQLKKYLGQSEKDEIAKRNNPNCPDE